MRNILFALGGICAVACACFAADDQNADTGKKLEQRSCTPCHSLRLIDSQRLSAGAWAKEMDKMIGWGAVVPEKQALIDYLAAQYSDAKPVPAPALSGNGTEKTR